MIKKINVKNKRVMKNDTQKVFKILYRVICVISILCAAGVLGEMLFTRSFDAESTVLVSVCVAVTIVGLAQWRMNYKIIKRQEYVIKNYKMYIRPLEDLTKEIRARQHEFDNHMNAVLNMHVMIDNYDELVKAQSEYIKNLYVENSRQLIALLKISDKILAGFIYSKVVASPDFINVNIQVRNFEIVSQVAENKLIEIIGTLIDNAYEACNEELNSVDIILDCEKNKIHFEVRNRVKDMSYSELSKFFQKGYSTKGKRRGLGLTNAKRIAMKNGGDITVELMNIDEYEYISFKVVI